MWEGKMEIDRAALLQAFLSEADEEVGRIEHAVLALEERPGDLSGIGAVFRAAHTLKGNASTLSLEAFAELAHAVEDVLDGLRGRKLTASSELTDLLLRAVDALRTMLGALRTGRIEDPFLYGALVEELGACAAQAEGEQPAPAPEAERLVVDRRWEPVLRVEVAKLDQLLGLAARISVVQGQIGASLLESAATRPELFELHDKNQRLLMELQDWVMDARMVPVGTLFRPHLRTVRDAARTELKRARLRVEGEQVRVDTGVADGIRDALTHLVRNAVDHGIEAPALRAAAGKPPEGTISLRAFHNGNQLIIQIADDGAGLNVAKIRARARALGRSNVDSLAPEALHRLIFEPGFSTADQVTGLSGRGVGMDVVLKKVEALHGTVDIESHQGTGTLIELRLPLTVSVIEGFWVEVAGTDYVLPLDDVVECLDLPPSAGGAPVREGMLDVRGEPLAFYRMRHLFGTAGEPPPGERVVVVRHERGQAGLAVDAIQGQRQAVIKPLGRLFRGVAGISGSTLRPDGRVALVVDVPRLLRSASRHAPELVAEV
jgi:two-component system chemotaxis sensor kinase CheA